MAPRGATSGAKDNVDPHPSASDTKEESNPRVVAPTLNSCLRFYVGIPSAGFWLEICSRSTSVVQTKYNKVTLGVPRLASGLKFAPVVQA